VLLWKPSLQFIIPEFAASPCVDHTFDRGDQNTVRECRRREEGVIFSESVICRVLLGQ
jgi:hypothetical protein